MEKLLTIRAATSADVLIIIELIKELADYEKLSHEAVATPELLRQNLFGEQPKAEVIIAEINNQPVGFALFFTNFSTFLGKPGIHLEDLYIKPEFRGMRAGKTILTYLARLAKDRDCGRVEWSVLDWNTPAIEFYKKLGASPMDEWTVFRVTGEALDKLAAEG